MVKAIHYEEYHQEKATIQIMVVYCYVSQYNTSPDYGTLPFYVPRLKGFLSVGTYVLLNGEGVPDRFWTQDGNVIARVVSCNYYNNTIDCNLLLPMRSIFATLNPAGQYQYHHLESGIAAGVVEVVLSQHQCVASTSDIEDVAFVFHIIDYLHGRVYGQGISNCFLLRYTYSINNQSLTPSDYESCFPSFYLDHRTLLFSCTVTSLWRSISNLQDILWKVLNRPSQNQNTTVKIMFPFDPILWGYLLVRSQGIVEEINFSDAGFIRSFTLKGMWRYTVWSPQRSSLLRFETQSQLQCLRSIIGASTTIGIRIRRPRLNCHDRLLPLTTVNAIIGSTTPELPIRRTSVRNRIDFFFNDYDSHIIVNYDSYVLSGNGRELRNNNYENIANNQYVTYMRRSFFPSQLE
jgi:hypothetical protein